MKYLDQDLTVVVVYPDKVALGVNAYLVKNKLPPVEVKELEYGMDEVTRISNTLGAKLLSGHEATIHGLLNILESHVDILWVISHGNEEGFFLNDGLVNASELTSLVRSAGVFLCVLNTCESYEAAHRMASELDVAVLCTITAVPDRSAFISGTLFARHLAAGMDYVTAWDKAKPGQNHPYQLFQARRPMNPQSRPNTPQNPKGHPATTEETLYQLENSVAELKRIVYGYPDLGLPPLRQITNELAKQFDVLKEDMQVMNRKLDNIERVQAERNRTMWFILFGLIVIGIAVAYLIFKG